jgi:Zn-dependent protease with chaperone function
MTEPTVDEGGRAILTGISSRAFEHPADRAALTAMRSIPGFDQFLRLTSGMLRERQYRLAYLASSVRVGPHQFSDLHELMDEVTIILDAPERPELYVYNHPVPNAITLGVDRAFIAISSALYELTDHDERRVVLGHELGHALSGHALYKSVLMHLLNLAASFSWVPAGGLGLRALIAALREWDRKSELSGDRAALLATQDLDACLRLHMKTAGGAHLDRIDVDAFLDQAAEYEKAGDLRDGILKLLNTETTTHPWSVVRAAEIRRWSDSEQYRAVLKGTYPLRADDKEASFADNARETARSYKKRMDESTDPLVSAVRNIGNTVGNAADSVVDWFNRTARGGVQDPKPQRAEHRDQPDDDATRGSSGEDILDGFERDRRDPDEPDGN